MALKVQGTVNCSELQTGGLPEDVWVNICSNTSGLAIGKLRLICKNHIWGTGFSSHDPVQLITWEKALKREYGLESVSPETKYKMVVAYTRTIDMGFLKAPWADSDCPNIRASNIYSFPTVVRPELLKRVAVLRGPTGFDGTIDQAWKSIQPKLVAKRDQICQYLGAIHNFIQTQGLHAQFLDRLSASPDFFKKLSDLHSKLKYHQPESFEMAFALRQWHKSISAFIYFLNTDQPSKVALSLKYLANEMLLWQKILGSEFCPDFIALFQQSGLSNLKYELLTLSNFECVRFPPSEECIKTCWESFKQHLLFYPDLMKKASSLIDQVKCSSIDVEALRSFCSEFQHTDYSECRSFVSGIELSALLDKATSDYRNLKSELDDLVGDQYNGHPDTIDEGSWVVRLSKPKFLQELMLDQKLKAKVTEFFSQRASLFKTLRDRGTSERG